MRYARPRRRRRCGSKLATISSRTRRITHLDLTPEQVYTADELRFTRDPFAAVIVAAARTLNLPLITRDAVIRGSGAVRVIW
jgi:PIN domain nuclease of toxin-antitoxin system